MTGQLSFDDSSHYYAEKVLKNGVLTSPTVELRLYVWSNILYADSWAGSLSESRSKLAI